LTLTPESLNEPGKEILFAHIASDLLDKGRLDDAIKISESGLKKVPCYAQGHFVLARCYQLKNKVEQAKAEFERVLRYDPNHVAAIREIAYYYRRNGMDDLYKKYLQQLVILDPINTTVIEEAKNAGIYQPWIIPQSEKKDVKAPEEKLDLSQFENRDDDFTTIMQGLFKQEEKTELKEEVETIERSEEPEKDEEIIADELPLDEAAYDYSLKSQEDLIQSLNGITDDTDGAYDIEIKEEMEGVAPDEPSSDRDDDQKKQTAEETQIEMESGSPKSEAVADEAQTTNDETTIIFEGEIAVDTNHVEEKETKAEQASVESEEEEQPDVFNENPKLISQTLAEILVSQKKYSEARNMFLALKKREPDNMRYDKKIEFLTRIIELNKQP
jgi:tetratricopeptide (TPR) repeat protein